MSGKKVIEGLTEAVDRAKFRVDLDAKGGLDDLSISYPRLVRLERMGNQVVWGRIVMDDGREVELSFTSSRPIAAIADVSNPRKAMETR